MIPAYQSPLAVSCWPTHTYSEPRRSCVSLSTPPPRSWPSVYRPRSRSPSLGGTACWWPVLLSSGLTGTFRGLFGDLTDASPHLAYSFERSSLQVIAHQPAHSPTRRGTGVLATSVKLRSCLFRPKPRLQIVANSMPLRVGPPFIGQEPLTRRSEEQLCRAVWNRTRRVIHFHLLPCPSSSLGLRKPWHLGRQRESGIVGTYL